MEFRLQPLGFMEFLQNNNHQAVKKMKWIEKIQSKDYWDFVGIFTCDCKCVSGGVRMLVWLIIAY